MSVQMTEKVLPANSIKMVWQRPSVMAKLVIGIEGGEPVTFKVPINSLREFALDIVAKLPVIDAPPSPTRQ